VFYILVYFEFECLYIRGEISNPVRGGFEQKLPTPASFPESIGRRALANCVHRQRVLASFMVGGYVAHLFAQIFWVWSKTLEPQLDFGLLMVRLRIS